MNEHINLTTIPYDCVRGNTVMKSMKWKLLIRLVPVTKYKTVFFCAPIL